MYDRLLTPTEAASILRTTKKTLAFWRCVNRHPELTYIKRGRSVFYLESVVNRFAGIHEAAV